MPVVGFETATVTRTHGGIIYVQGGGLCTVVAHLAAQDGAVGRDDVAFQTDGADQRLQNIRCHAFIATVQGEAVGTLSGRSSRVCCS